MGLVGRSEENTLPDSQEPPFPRTASPGEGTAHVGTHGPKDLGKEPWIIRALQAT